MRLELRLVRNAPHVPDGEVTFMLVEPETGTILPNQMCHVINDDMDSPMTVNCKFLINGKGIKFNAEPVEFSDLDKSKKGSSSRPDKTDQFDWDTYKSKREIDNENNLKKEFSETFENVRLQLPDELRWDSYLKLVTEDGKVIGRAKLADLVIQQYA